MPAFTDYTNTYLGNAAVALCCSAALLACNDATRQSNGQASRSDGEVSSASAGASRNSDAQPAVVDGHAIIRAEAVGPLHLNTWRRPVMSLVYVVGATAGPHGEDMITVRGIGHDTMALAFLDDTLRWINVNRPGPHTAEGIGVGTPLSAAASESGATSRSADGVQIITLNRYCGIEFRSDSAVHKQAPTPARIASILVRPCAGGASRTGQP